MNQHWEINRAPNYRPPVNMPIPDRNNRAKFRSIQELRELAAATSVSDGRINDLVNNVLGYLEKYKDGLPKGLKEAAFMDFCRAEYLLFVVIPNHVDFANFITKKKHSAFYESYETLRSLLEAKANSEIPALESWLTNRDSFTQHESSSSAKSSYSFSLQSAPSVSNGTHNVARKPLGSPMASTVDLMSRFEKLRPPALSAANGKTSSNDTNGKMSSTGTNGRNKASVSALSHTHLSNHLAQHAIERPSHMAVRPSVVFPKSTVINTEKLEYYLTHAPEKILLLDIRSRRDFDRGYIDQTANVVCIEPVSLRDGMNDENLEDTLVLAPESEQLIFSQRDTFELVVYYDWDSRTNQYRGGPVSDAQQLALYYLTRSLYDYAFSKPLKRPPCLLIGGYEAWMEDIHNLSITTSTSTPPPGSTLSGQAFKNEQNFQQYHPAASALPQPPSTDIVSRPHGLTRKGSVAATTPQLEYSRDINDYFRTMPTMYSSHKQHPNDDIPTSPVASPKPAVYSSSSFAPQSTGNSIHSMIDGRRSSLSSISRHPPPPTHAPPPPPASSSGQNIQQAIPPSHWHDPHQREDEQRQEQWLQQQQQQQKQQLWQTSSEFTTGLRNLGNTCYLNCIVQCLAGTPSLSMPLADGSYKRWVNVQSKLGFKGVLAQKFAELVQTLLQEQVACVGPMAIKELSGRLREQFSGFEQQDCQEFLTFILDGLHEDLNSNGNKERLKELTLAEEARREHMSVRVASTIEWERYLKSDFSLIVDTCQGQYQSQLRCLTCGHTSTTYNAFSFLSLPIPMVGRGNPVSILDCFNLFTAEEILDGDDAWHCPKCKKPRRSSKRLTIARLPSVLIVHLKRFHHRYDGTADKLETFVTYPTTSTLDLTSYWPPYAGDDDAKLAKLPVRGQTAPFLYKLYAVANHFGTLKGGHYTAFVNKGRKGWCLFDDDRISRNVHPDHVMTRHGYVLFFQRQTVLA